MGEVCFKCGQAITGTYIKALEKTWHPEHFVCNKCSKELTSTGFLAKDGMPYCKADYVKLFCDKCTKCNQPITSEIVNALGKLWHSSCFTCEICSKPISTPDFYEKGGKAYCNEDYTKLFGVTCSGCQKPIISDYLTALNGAWHPSCFKCKECEKQIKRKFHIVDQLAVCNACIKNKKKN